MAKKNTIQMNKISKNKQEVVELEKATPTSIISVSRELTLNVDFLDPKTLDELYATVPEITRTIDLRGAAVISKGFEITERDDSELAKKFASICLQVINNSGGVSFIEQWQKNADLYGNGYAELVDDGSKIIRLAHIHSKNFGYELEEFEVNNTTKTRVKLDKETQLPVGFANYKFNDVKQVLENVTTYEINRIAHLKYKCIGDALYGISIVQPMQGSVIRKLKLEKAAEDAGRMVSAPKIVISGDFADNNEAREQAKEAASLDVSDVIILQNDKEFKIVNPGETSIPQLREIFITNITSASGIPRPILTSEGNDINKATIQELTKSLRQDMRSNINKIKAMFETFIFRRIGETYSIPNYESIIPMIDFPDDDILEQEAIVREEKKAATITSISNSLMLMNNMMMGSKSTPANTEKNTELSKAMDVLFETLQETVKTFSVNDDQTLGKIEEDINIGSDTSELMLSVDARDEYNIYSMDDQIDTIQQREVVEKQHFLVHEAFSHLMKGSLIRDNITGEEIRMMDLIQKHRFYVESMHESGLKHPEPQVAPELDQILRDLQNK